MSDFEKLKDKKRLEMQARKAEAAIAELEWKIIEREEDIQRMKDHIDVQKKIKTDSEAELAKLS